MGADVQQAVSLGRTHSADREHGKPGSDAGGRDRIRADRAAARVGRGGIHGAQKKPARPAPVELGRLCGRVYRPAEEQLPARRFGCVGTPGGTSRNGQRLRNPKRVLPELRTPGPDRERHIDPVVDDDQRPKLRRLAQAVSDDWDPNEPPEPAHVFKRIADAGFRLPVGSWFVGGI